MTERAVLYHAKTGNSLRAAIAVELAGGDVDRRFVDLSKNEQKDPSFLSINPAGTVPTYVEPGGIECEELVLTQSGAILNYLTSLHRPELWPDSPREQALADSGIMSAVSDIAIQNALMVYMTFHDDSIVFLQGRLLSAISAAFQPVRDREFLGGDTVNIVDFAHFPVIYMREALLQKTSESDHIVRWLNRMREIPEVGNAIAYAGRQLPA